MPLILTGRSAAPLSLQSVVPWTFFLRRSSGGSDKLLRGRAPTQPEFFDIMYRQPPFSDDETPGDEASSLCRQSKHNALAEPDYILSPARGGLQ